MKTKRQPKIELKQTKAGGQKGAWRYTIKSANGETLATSEGYTSKQGAERGLLDLTTTVLAYVGDRFRDWAWRHME